MHYVFCERHSTDQPLSRLPLPPSSKQLVDHPLIRPSSIHNPDVLAQYADEYLYLGCVRFVKQARGPGADWVATVAAPLCLGGGRWRRPC